MCCATPLARRGGQSRGPQATPLEEGGGEPGATPPLSPHSPPSGPRDAGDGPRGRRSLPPQGQVKPPPHPPPPPPQKKKSRGAQEGNAAKPVRHAPPRCHLAAPTETTTGRRTRASTQGRHAAHTRGHHANMNRGSMETRPSMN